MPEILSHFLITFSAIFFVIDPVGLVPIFLALTSGYTPEKRRKIASRATKYATLILFAFTLFGTLIFKAFGITLGAFKIAGGILLLMTAFDMLKAQASRTRSSPEETEEGHEKEDVALIPLAIPLLAGPGAIASAMVSVSRGEGIQGVVIVLVSITVTMIISYALLIVADRLSRFLGKSGIAMVERIMGLLVAAIGVQFVADGVFELLSK